MAIFTRPREGDVALPSAPWPDGNGTAHGNGNGHGNGTGHGNGHRLGRPGAGRLMLGRRWWWLVLAAVVAAGLLAAADAGGTATYPLSADFAQAPGLFPGAAVEVLGVPVGTVTSVRNVGDEVTVGLAIDHGRAIPAAATASLVSPEILGEPSIELSPGYAGGAALRSGAVIPMSRTAVPVSTEQVLKTLRATLQHINPHAVGDLVTNLAQDLSGQGKNLNTLIAGAAGTLKLLATKADTLGQMNGSLAQLTGALDARTSQITQLITDYDTVSGVIAQHSSQLGGALVQFSKASTELVQLLEPNLRPLESDVGTITKVGRTLDRNLTSVDEIFSASRALFTGARRVYTSTYNWITLNSQSPPGLTGAVLSGMVKSRLAGVCRRLLAHHSTGLTAKERKTLQTCGNPSSAFFDSIVSQIPTVLKDVRAGKIPQPTSPAKMIQQGLAKIPGASEPPKASKSSTSSAPTSSSGGSGSSSTPSPGAPGAGSTTPTSTCLSSLLGGLGCTSGSATPATGTSGSGSSGLLAYHVPAPAGALARPSLTASATRELPPLPPSAPGASRHRAPAHHRHGAHGAHGAHLASHRDARRSPRSTT